MKTSITKFVLVAGISVSAITTLNSCSKSETAIVTASSTGNQSYIESTLLNRDLTIPTAIDDGVNVTGEFSGYTFQLTGSTSGTARAIKDTTIIGNWSLNSSRDKITFDFPPTLNNQQPLAFLNKEWNITSGSNPVKLTAANGQNDVLYLAPR